MGHRHLFLRLAGCNLCCRYCDTPEARERSPRFRLHDPALGFREMANPVTPEQLLPELLRMLEANPPIDGVALTGGEPLCQAEFLGALLRSPDIPHPRLLETNGSFPDALLLVLPWVDMVSMDIKLPSSSGQAPLWDLHLAFLRAAAGKVYVKILVDEETALEEVARAAALASAGDPAAPVFLQPITGPEGRIAATAQRLGVFFAAARQHVRNVRILPQIHPIIGAA